MQHFTACGASFCPPAAGPRACLLRVRQSVQPRGLPPLLAPAMARFVTGQVRLKPADESKPSVACAHHADPFHSGRLRSSPCMSLLPGWCAAHPARGASNRGPSPPSRIAGGPPCTCC